MADLPFDIDKLDVHKQLLELDKYECEQSLMTFLERAWPHFDPAPFDSNWHMDAVCEHLEAIADVDEGGAGIRRLIVNIPPRSAKTSICSIVFPAWVWAQSNKGPNSGPHVKFLYVSYNESLSREHSIACRRLVKSEWYQERWPHVKITDDVDNLSKFETTAGGSRTISSIGSRVTGKGADCFVAGTQVTTPTGSLPIEDILPGEEVYGVDTSRGKVLKTKVSAVRRVPVRDLYEVSVSGGVTLRCSGDHPFFHPQSGGYVKAASLGRGDRVWVSGAEKRQDKNSTASEMQMVPRAAFQTAIRGAQSLKKQLRRFILLSGMPRETPRGKKLNETMRQLRYENGAKKQFVLLNRMRARFAGQEDRRASAECVQILPTRLYLEQHTPQVLQRHLPKPQPLAEHTRSQKSTVRAWAESTLRGVLPSLAGIDRRAGQGVLRSVWVGGTETNAVEWKVGDSTTRSSHRREPGTQSPGKPSGTMRFMPQDCASIEQSTVLNVEKYSGDEEWMYDIEVEGTHNFFANGVLVHNCIILDDPNATNDVSENKLTEVTDYFDNTLRSRLNNPKTGAILLVQQRTAEQDLTGHILEKYEKDGYDHLMIPMEFEPDRSFETSIGWKDPRTYLGEPMWPERFNEVFITAEKRNKYVWAGQYMMRPEVAGGGIIKRDWWQPWEERSFPPMDYILASLDTAYTVKTSNDPSAMTVWGVFTTDEYAHAGRTIDVDGRPIYFDRAYNETAPKLMLMHAWSEHLEFHDLIKKVEKTCRALKVDKLLIENKAAGISVAQELRRLYGSADFGVQLSDPKSMDKMARLFSVQHLFEEGIIYAPDKTWADQVITEVGAFPKGKRDDLCFVAGTKIATRRGSVPIEQIVTGDQVLTPFGFKRVAAAGSTGIHEVVSKAGLCGTPAHPLFVVGTGWRALDTVTRETKLARLNLCDLIRITHPKQLNLMRSLSDEWAERENTICRKAEPTPESEKLKGCMSPFGNITTEPQYLRSTTYTTSTVTRLTATLQIWSAYRLACIGAWLKTLTWKNKGKYWKKPVFLRPHGTNPTKGALGTERLRLRVWWPLGLLWRQRDFFLPRSGDRACGAEPQLSTGTAEGCIVLTSAAADTPNIDSENSKQYTPILQEVYNLTVEDAHCYYADGVLVHNCDTVSQAIRHLREMGLLTRSQERIDEIESHKIYPGGAHDAPLYPS